MSKPYKTAVVAQCGEAKAFNVNNEEAQFLETREFGIRQVANWFGLPPHKLGDDSRTSYNSLEQENQSYLDSLDQWLVSWESECRAKILTGPQKERDSHTIEFVRQALLEANLSDRAEYYEKAVRNGWMTRDEVRGLENMNPLAQSLGSAATVEKNMLVYESDGSITNEDGERAIGDLLEQTAERMAKRLAGHLEQEKDIGLEKAHGDIVREAMDPIIRALNAVDGAEHDSEVVVEQFFRAAIDADAENRVKEWQETYPAQLRENLINADA